MGKNSKSRRNRGTRRKTRGARGVGELTEEEMDPGLLLLPPPGRPETNEARARERLA